MSTNYLILNRILYMLWRFWILLLIIIRSYFINTTLWLLLSIPVKHIIRFWPIFSKFSYYIKRVDCGWGNTVIRQTKCFSLKPSHFCIRVGSSFGFMKVLWRGDDALLELSAEARELYYLIYLLWWWDKVWLFMDEYLMKLQKEANVVCSVIE